MTPAGHGAKVGRRQELAIAALLTAATLDQAAQACGLSKATLTRWLRMPEFLTAFRAARRAAVEAAIGRLQQATVAAVDALERNLTCGRASVEVAAARTVLEQAVRGIELMDLEERLDALERQLPGRRPS